MLNLIEKNEDFSDLIQKYQLRTENTNLTQVNFQEITNFLA